MPLPETLPRGVRRRQGSSVANSTSVGNNDDMASYLLSVGGQNKNNSKRRSRRDFSSNASTSSSTDSTAITVVTGTVGTSSVAQYSVATTVVEDDESRCLYGTGDKYGYGQNEQRQPEEEGIGDFQGVGDDESDSDDNSSKSSDGDSISSCDDGTAESLAELSAIIDSRKFSQEQQSHQRQGQQKSILDRLSQSPRQIAQVSTADQEYEADAKLELGKLDLPILPEERIEVWIDASLNESQNREERKTKKDARADKFGGRKKSFIQFFRRTTLKNKSSPAIFSKANNDKRVETTKELDDDSRREPERENDDISQMYDLEDENSIVASQCTIISEEEQNQLPIATTRKEEDEEEEKEESQSTIYRQQESVDEKPKNVYSYNEDFDAAYDLSDVEMAATTKERNYVDGNSCPLPISCCIDGASTIPEHEEEMVFVKSTSTKEPLVESVKPQSILKSHSGTHCDIKTAEAKNDGENNEAKSTIPSTLPLPAVSRVVLKPYVTRKKEGQRRRIHAMFDDKSPPEQVEESCNKIKRDVNSCKTPAQTHTKKEDENQASEKTVNIFKRLPDLLLRQRNKHMKDDPDERNGEDNLDDNFFADREAERSSIINPSPALMLLSKSKTHGKADEGADRGRSTSSRSVTTIIRRRRSVSPFRRGCSKSQNLQGMVNAYKAERIANRICKRRSSLRLGRLVSQEQLYGGLSHDRRVIKQSINKEKGKQIPPNHAVDQLPGAPEKNGHQKGTGYCNSDWRIFNLK